MLYGVPDRDEPYENEGHSIIEINLDIFIFFYPGIELFFRRAPPAVLLPRQSFTTKFEMDRCGSSTPGTPEYQPLIEDTHRMGKNSSV